MANNLFVTYDLIKTKDYEAVYKAIKSLGNWAKVTESNWYVNSNYTASQAFDIVKKSIDSDDKLIVVDASNNSAAWVNLAPEVPEYIKDQWFK
ncbi:MULTISPECIES: hypothetical protein [Serratia]|uniref:hypothetical protein n=1 Tax=Serratia TaxID=613 RepID=UPI002ACECE5E|nr:hypothetical protein [Serratia marcescens]MDZ7426837.1 hypothetical protein [Serratia marcescens]MDZ7484355.1 hypothetical protein [Serratia marcescens]MDZ7522946.1 hypothetical protein [Serratia marcescens]